MGVRVYVVGKGKGEGGGGRPRANCVWGVYPLTCFYWQRLQWWNVSNIKAKYSLHHVQRLHTQPSFLLPPFMTGALLPSSALTVLGYSFWCCCCCCCLACLVSGLVCLHSEANPSTQLNPGTNATSPRPERENVVGEREFGAALSPLTCGHYKNQWINIYMPKYLTTKKKQMYNRPPLLNAYLSRGVSTEEGKRGSCQGPGASPVCTYTLDYWYVFQSPPPPLPTPSLIHCKFAFYANDFSLRFS